MAEFTMDMVREWCKGTTGQFHYKQILDNRINIKENPKAYDKLRAYVSALCQEGVIEPVGKNDGYYRHIEEMSLPIKWDGVNSLQDSGVVLPFNLRDYVWIDPNTSIVVAGSKDSGKTGFLMRTVFLNMTKKRVVFLCNMEGGVNQVKRRFEAMGIDMGNPPFQTFMVMDNFHDAMKEPDTLWVIDYIDVPETGEFYMIAPLLAKIQEKLRGGVAVIGLQKKMNSDIAYGGEQTLKKTTLYLAMNPGKIKIIRAKISVDPKVNLTNKQWSFKYDEEGTEFINIQEYFGEY